MGGVTLNPRHNKEASRTTRLARMLNEAGTCNGANTCPGDWGSVPHNRCNDVLSQCLRFAPLIPHAQLPQSLTYTRFCVAFVVCWLLCDDVAAAAAAAAFESTAGCASCSLGTFTVSSGSSQITVGSGSAIAQANFVCSNVCCKAESGGPACCYCKFSHTVRKPRARTRHNTSGVRWRATLTCSRPHLTSCAHGILLLHTTTSLLFWRAHHCQHSPFLPCCSEPQQLQRRRQLSGVCPPSRTSAHKTRLHSAATLESRCYLYC